MRFALLAAATLAASGAFAADLAPEPVAPPPPVPVYQFVGWELRAGGYAHDPLSPEKKGIADFNGEIIFPKFYSLPGTYWDLAIPRVSVGTTANFAGKTSNVYGDLVWTFELPYHFFMEGQFGGGVNNGKTGAIVPQGFSKVGCHEWFHESGTFGYRFTENWSVMGTIEHSSNAGFCTQNRGLTNYGLRVGYRF